MIKIHKRETILDVKVTDILRLANTEKKKNPNDIKEIGEKVYTQFIKWIQVPWELDNKDKNVACKIKLENFYMINSFSSKTRNELVFNGNLLINEIPFCTLHHSSICNYANCTTNNGCFLGDYFN